MLLLLALLALLPACVTTPDGRRVLSPAARAAGQAQVEHVLRCGLQAASSALASGGQPDYLAASVCHLRLFGEQLGRGLVEAAPAPSEEHGRKVVRASQLSEAGDRGGAKKVARECNKDARERWLSEETR